MYISAQKWASITVREYKSRGCAQEADIVFVDSKMLDKYRATSLVVLFYEDCDPEPVGSLLNQLIRRSCHGGPALFVSLDSTEIPDWLLNIHIPYTSEVYVLLKDRSNHQTGQLKMVELYHIDEEISHLQVNELAWQHTYEEVDRSLHHKWQFSKQQKHQRRCDLQGALVTAAYPEIMLRPDDPTGIKAAFHRSIEGFMETLSATNLTLKHEIAGGELVGEPNATGQWTGTIGMLQQGLCNISLLVLTPSADMLSVVDFLSPISTSHFRLIVRKPEHQFSMRTLYSEFSPCIWAVCVAFFSLFVVLVTVLSHFYEKYGIPVRRIEFTEGLLFVLGNFSNQAWHHVPSCLSMRKVCFLVVLTGYLLNVSYVSQLQAQLTAGDAKLPFRTLNELVDLNTYPVLIYRNSFPHQTAQNASRGVMKKLKTILAQHKDYLFTNFYAALEHVCNEQAVMFASYSIMLRLIRDTDCPVVVLPDQYFKGIVALPTTKEFLYKKLFNYQIHLLMESGVESRLQMRHRWSNMKQVSENFQVIELKHIFPLLFLYVGIIFVSIVMLVIEKMYWIACQAAHTAVRADFKNSFTYTQSHNTGRL
ncbi:probable glutamate receptor [Periplaneta americana]|uniref:probable glutamate receptor n=1 Tax=Periplaneta americana TaxID=6978 RepID=UPI0037E9C335